MEGRELAKTRFQAPAITGSLTLANLTQVLVQAFQTIVSQLNSWSWAQDEAQQNVSMATNRITNLGDPASGKDAVNRDYVQKAIAGVAGGAGGLGVNTATVVVSATIQIGER